MVEPVVWYRFAASRMLGSSSPGASTPDSTWPAISLLTCRYLAMARTLPATAGSGMHVFSMPVVVLAAWAGAPVGSAPFCTRAEGGSCGPQTRPGWDCHNGMPGRDPGRRVRQQRGKLKRHEPERVEGAGHADRVRCRHAVHPVHR